MRYVLFAILLLTAGLSLADENWPQFRGPRGDGTSDANGIPLTWSETEHVKWKTRIEGKGWSSPVVWNKQIWMSTATEDGKDSFAICVDRDTGEIVHHVAVLHKDDPMYCHPMNSYATPTPVVEPGHAYFHFGSHGTLALDTTSGQILWLRDDLPCNHHRGPGSSPIVYENLLIVPYDGFDLQYVVAFEKHTGKTVWKKDRNIVYATDNGDIKKAYGTCSVFEIGGRQQLIAPSAEATIAYDPLTGEELWRVKQGGMNVSARPLYGLGMLFLNTAAGGLKLFAMRPEGRGELPSDRIVWKSSKNVGTRPSQLLVGDLIFMVSDAGVGSCIDAKTGDTLWQERFQGDHSASPLYANGRVYFFSQDGQSTVVQAVRQFKQLAVNQLGDGFMASPAVVGNALYLRSRSHLYRIEN